MTFWEDLGEQVPAEPVSIARALLRLHSLRVPAHLALPRFALPDYAKRIREAQTSDSPRRWLAQRAERLVRRWEAVQWPDEWCVIHADPSPQNTMQTAYGADVTLWDGYTLIRDIRSLGLALFALRHADTSDHARSQADYRLACLMGRHGERPWKWVSP